MGLDFARLIQWDYWGGGNQRFRLDPVGDGFYRIMLEHSGKCLDVAGISAANGAPIIRGNTGAETTRNSGPRPQGMVTTR